MLGAGNEWYVQALTLFSFWIPVCDPDDRGRFISLKEKLLQKQGHCWEVGHCHILKTAWKVGRGVFVMDLLDHETAVIGEAVIGDLCRGERNSTERLDRVSVELEKCQSCFTHNSSKSREGFSDLTDLHGCEFGVMALL